MKRPNLSNSRRVYLSREFIDSLLCRKESQFGLIQNERRRWVLLKRTKTYHQRRLDFYRFVNIRKLESSLAVSSKYAVSISYRSASLFLVSFSSPCSISFKVSVVRIVI